MPIFGDKHKTDRKVQFPFSADSASASASKLTFDLWDHSNKTPATPSQQHYTRGGGVTVSGLLTLS